MSFASDIPNADRLDFERLRGAALNPGRSGSFGQGDALPAMLGRIISVQAKVKPGQFCRVAPAEVLGVEGEGGLGVFADQVQAANAPPVLVYLLGSFVPAVGDYLVCRFVDHRWVAETSGGTIVHGSSGILLPSCFCMVPPSLQMISASPDCNYQMFQSCTLRYGPPPPAMVEFGYTGNVFTSSTCHDPLTNSDFFYYFWCQYNQFFLTRIFPTSPFGSPYRDGILYTWIVGGYGNTCDPFQLEQGSPFPGSDLTCSVSITGS